MNPPTLPGTPEPWTRDQTMAYLNANPLPRTFLWPHRDGGERPVHPSHSYVTGYGKWLRETPYFRGLFERIHAALAAESAATGTVGDADWLAAQLHAERTRPAPETATFL